MSECKFYSVCPDIRELTELRDRGTKNSQYEDLAEQAIELCSTGGFNCLQKNELLKKGALEI